MARAKPSTLYLTPCRSFRQSFAAINFPDWSVRRAKGLLLLPASVLSGIEGQRKIQPCGRIRTEMLTLGCFGISRAIARHLSKNWKARNGLSDDL
jgi:hypothetical protein